LAGDLDIRAKDCARAVTLFLQRVVPDFPDLPDMAAVRASAAKKETGRRGTLAVTSCSIMR
jgi:hypothetical protein